STITTGYLYLDGGTGGWYSDAAGTTSVAGNTMIPGETYYYVASAMLHAKGTNLAASLAVTGTTPSGFTFATPTKGSLKYQTDGTAGSGFTVGTATYTGTPTSGSSGALSGIGLTTVSAGSYTVTGSANLGLADGAIIQVSIPFTFNNVTLSGANNGTNDQGETITAPTVALNLTQTGATNTGN
ncbi:hypothetical protein, partial [Gryllotalpicola sp.]|uniref:hypothetical protein n=1 Tax=Gryllotalpicola sp. TaxID=1932787 RepID=UPI00261B906C